MHFTLNVIVGVGSRGFNEPYQCDIVPVKNLGSLHRAGHCFITVSTFGQTPIPSSVCVQWVCTPQRPAETRTCEKLKLLKSQHMFLPGNTTSARNRRTQDVLPE